MTAPDKQIGEVNHCALEEVEAYLSFIDVKQPNGRDYLPVRVARQLVVTMREVDRLRERLGQISFMSHGCPVRLDFEDVPERYQEVIRNELRRLGEMAEDALSYKQSSPSGWESMPTIKDGDLMVDKDGVIGEKGKTYRLEDPTGHSDTGMSHSEVIRTPNAYPNPAGPLKTRPSKTTE